MAQKNFSDSVLLSLRGYTGRPTFLLSTVFGIFIAWSVFFSPALMYAQNENQCGVYLNDHDFLHHNLSIGICCEKKKCRMQIPDKPVIIVVERGHKKKYPYDSILGFRDCKGNEFRVMGGKKYQIINQENFILYDLFEDVGNGESVYFEHKYFFSLKVDTDIFPLKKYYLDIAFKNNTRFIYFVSHFFSTDRMLISRNDSTNRYKLIDLYTQSKEE